MPTKQPTPPPPPIRLVNHPKADFALLLAMRWRQEQLRGDKMAEESCYLALCLDLDEIIRDIANPPTSPPTPKRQG
jgi:hypothetical protein